MIDFGRTEELWIRLHVFLPLQPDARKGDVDEVAHRMAHACGDDVVVRRRLLQHEPHRAHVIAGETPVALRIQIAHRQLGRETKRDPCCAVGHLAGDELQTSAR